MKTITPLQMLFDKIFGHKYYANIINTRGTMRTEICSYIFFNRNEAMMHQRTLEGTASFRYLQTISFRSRIRLTCYSDDPLSPYNSVKG